KKKNHVIVEAAGKSKMNLLFSTKGDFERLNRDSENIQNLLADVAEQFINYPVKGLVLFGGDTAMSIATRTRAKGIHILSQVEPYIPMGIFIESKTGTIPVVTKAGGFGNENTLTNILNQL
ncbi:MAG: hypothetical protein GX321_04365, partial [Clostridiales bacterium]|nr:hypothetical protein [Clostridiales bacterium]